MRKFLIFVLIVAIGCAAWLYWAALLPVDPGEAKFVLLRPGWSVRHIAQTCSSRASSAARRLSWRCITRWAKAASRPASTSLRSCERHGGRRRLLRGDVYARTVAVPEGYNMYDMRSGRRAGRAGAAADFVAVARNELSCCATSTRRRSRLRAIFFPTPTSSLASTRAHDIAAAMVHRFRQTAQKIGLLGRPDIHRIVTMASIVEKETGAPEERPMVAGVYYNRLERNMLLARRPERHLRRAHQRSIPRHHLPV